MAAHDFVRPDPKKMFGLTHQPDGTAIVRVPRVIKVGIGLPKGKDIHAYIDNAGGWKVRMGDKVTAFASKEEARKFYRANKDLAPDKHFPRKLEYFTFSRPDGTGSFDPDFDAIEAHGAFPREIDILFTDDRPLQASFQMWTQTELKCQGDGINAMRVLSMAANEEENRLVEQAKNNGEKYFPIVDGCWTRDCPYSKASTGPGGKEIAAPCKPHARLQFQLLFAPRLGGVAQFDSTSFRSISQLFSSLHTFYKFTGQGNPDAGYVSGIPLKLVLSPFKIVHNGKSGKAYAVSLEFRTEDATQLRKKLLEHAMEFRRAIAPPIEIQKQIEAVAEHDDEEDFEPRGTIQEATAFTAEFTEGDGEEDETVPDVPETGSIEEAAEVAIRKIAEEYGYTVEQVRECYDDPKMMPLLAYKFGPPPKDPAKAPEKHAESKQCSCVAPDCMVLSENSIPAGTTCREDRRPVTEMNARTEAKPEAPTKPTQKLQFGRKPIK